MKPSITVVIPSFNRISFLTNALESVFNQTYKNIEVVVINDGSTDPGYKSHKYIKEVKQIDLEKNQKTLHGYGPGSIRNFGKVDSSAKYVAFLDDDDIWLPTKLEEQINALENSKEKMICSDALIGNGPYVDNVNYKSYLNEHYFKKHRETYFSNRYVSKFRKFSYPEVWTLSFLDSFQNLANPIITSSVIVEKELLDNVGWFRNLPFSADYDCWRGIMQFTNCRFIDKSLIYYDNNHGDGRNYYK